MSFPDRLLPQQKIITIRYRDKYVDLVSDAEHYGTMTTNTAGDRIEFDFSNCRVVGTRDVPVAGVELVPMKECPPDMIVPESALLEAANTPEFRALMKRGLLE